MVSSFTTNKSLEKPANGDYVDTWNIPVNGDMDVIDQALGATTFLNATGGSATLTVSQYRAMALNVSGAMSGNVVYTIPSGVGGSWIVFNNTTDASGGPWSVTIRSAGGGTTVVVKRGFNTTVYSDGTNIRLADNSSVAGGSDTQVQFNQNTLFGGSANFVFDYTNSRVGIGTSSPATTLDVNGVSTLRGITNVVSDLRTGSSIDVNYLGSGDRNAVIDFYTDNTYTDYSMRLLSGAGANGGRYLVGRGTGGVYLVAEDAAPLIFNTTNSERARITPAGDMGIGTNSPGTTKLFVNTSNSTSYSFIARTPNAGLSAGNFVNMAYFANSRGTNNDGLRIVNVRDQTTGSAGNWETESFRIRRSVDQNDGSTGVQEEIVFGNNEFGINVGGSRQLTATLSGNIGIGTTNPGYKLTVTGVINSTTGGFRFPDGTTQTTAAGVVSIAAGRDISISGSTGNVTITSTAIPVGVILMWSGSVASIPSTWRICDGGGGTPDLRDRFIVGAGGSYGVGATGGANSITLSQGEMPYHEHDVIGTTGFMSQNQNHSHGVSDPGHSHGTGQAIAQNAGGNPGFASGPIYSPTGYLGNTSGSTTNISINSANVDHSHYLSIRSGGAGSSQAHENRPPFYALCYIMKVS